MQPVGQRFLPEERVCMPLATRTATGTVMYDDGQNVRVRWDDGTVGDLVRDDTVAYNAHRLQSLRESER